MKKILLVSLFSISIFVINAQEVFMFSPIIVADEDIENFEMIQKKYVTPMAQDAVKNKSMKQWALIKKVPGIGNPDNKTNYMWVAAFDNINQMVNRENWWSNTEKKFGVPSEVIYDSPDIVRRGRYIYKTEKQIQTDKPGQYVILNWATPTNLNKMIELQGSVEKHFRKNIIKSGMVGWGMATRIVPQNKDLPTAFWWDSYDTLENAYKHLAGQAATEGISKEINEEFNKLIPNGWDNRVIFEFVTGAN
jgi:hypothetical protein|tara:strand:+ start:39 stop:785 length:747 start_codon:yes stop_codon:yes gene_type:complete